MKLLVVAGGYLLGSFLPAVVFVKHRIGQTPWEIGENPGSAGVWRLTGPPYGILTGAFDIAKGILPVTVARQLGMEGWWFVASVCAPVIGHNWSIFYGFRGGRGLATAIGALLCVSWSEMAPACVAGIIASLITKWTPMLGVVAFPTGLILMMRREVEHDRIFAAVSVIFLLILRQLPWLIEKVQDTSLGRSSRRT